MIGIAKTFHSDLIIQISMVKQKQNLFKKPFKHTILTEQTREWQRGIIIEN